MFLDVYYIAGCFNNEEILKYPYLNWDEGVLLFRDFSREQLELLRVNEKDITCLHGSYQEISKLQSPNLLLVLNNKCISFEDMIKCFQNSKSYTKKAYIKYASNEDLMKHVTSIDYVSYMLLTYRRGVTLELLNYYKFSMDDFEVYSICQQSFMKHFNWLKEIIYRDDRKSFIYQNLAYKTLTTNILNMSWMSIELAMDIKHTFDKIKNARCSIEIKDIAMKFSLKDLLKYDINIINCPDIYNNPDINNIIHHLPTILFDIQTAMKVLSLQNLKRYFPDYIRYKNLLYHNKHVTIKEAIEHELNIEFVLPRTSIKDIPYNFLCKIKEPELISDITISYYQLFKMKRYDHIYRLHTPFINTCYLHDVDFIF
ncbi:hypothetical protein D3C87_906990 [compost metagenome]